MPGKKTERTIWNEPLIHFFNPHTVPMDDPLYHKEELTFDELEAMRLTNLEDKSQKEGAELMNISQSTFHRILVSGRKKITRALVDGKSIHLISSGNSRTFKYGYGCMECNFEYFPDKKVMDDIEKLLPLNGVACKNPDCASHKTYHLLREISEPKSKDTEECPDNNEK